MKLIRILLLAAARAWPAACRPPRRRGAGRRFGHVLHAAAGVRAHRRASDDRAVEPEGRSTTCSPAATPRRTARSPACSRKRPPTCPPSTAPRVASIGQRHASRWRASRSARRRRLRARSSALSTERSLQARKDLTAMGLRYHDPKDFLEAVKRDDELAVGAVHRRTRREPRRKRRRGPRRARRSRAPTATSPWPAAG